MRLETVICLLIVTLMSSSSLFAHNSNRKRIEALELAVRKNNTVLAQQLADIEEKLKQSDEAKEERRVHATRLQQRMRSLEDGVEQGLRAIRDTLAKEIDKRLVSLERGQKRVEKENSSLRQSVVAYEKTLAAFRKSLTEYSKRVDGELLTLRQQVVKQETQHKKDNATVLSRIDGLLQIVDSENKKLRSAITTVSRSSGGPLVHVVQNGENLWVIARKYNLSTKALLKANKRLKNVSSVIHPGDKIIIPAQ
mgnify:CR=1 FL=1